MHETKSTNNKNNFEIAGSEVLPTGEDLGGAVAFLLHLADTTLILSQRNSEWCGHGPILEPP